MLIMRRCNGTALESDLSLTLVVQSEKRFLFKFCKTLQNFILVAQATHIPCFNIVTNSLCTDDAKLERHINTTWNKLCGFLKEGSRIC